MMRSIPAIFAAIPKWRAAFTSRSEKIGARSEAVHQVIGDGDPSRRSPERVRAEDIPRHDLDIAAPWPSLQSRGVARQAPYAGARLKQSRDKPAADISGGSGDQHGGAFKEVVSVSSQLSVGDRGGFSVSKR